MKKFVFAFCLFFPSILASDCYAQLDLDELMETAKAEDAAENSAKETATVATAIEDAAENSAKETVSEDASSALQAETDDFEKSLDDLFADDMNAVIGDEKPEEKAADEALPEEKAEELPTAEKEADTIADTAPENADNEPVLKDDEANADAKNQDENKAEETAAEETESVATGETEAQSAPTDEKTATDSANEEEIDIFADDEVGDLFDEPTPNKDEKADEPQDAADVLPIDSENANQANKDDFMDDYFEDLEEQKQRDETAYKAQKDALRLISDEPQVVTLKDEQCLSLREANQKRKEMEKQLKAAKAKQPPLAKPAAFIAEKTDTPEDDSENEETAKTTENPKVETANEPESTFTVEAPFGLRWNAGKEEIEAMGFATAPAEMDNYQGVYVVRNPQQPQKTFTLVTAVFGTQNHLQAIYAQSQPQDDTPQAEKVLKLYHQYYDALKQKYGNDKEHFIPNMQTIVEEQKAVAAENSDAAPAENAEIEEDTTPANNGIGNDNFLNELKEEKAALFATFNDDNVKVTLTVLADEKGKSYITLDYENTYVTQNEQSANFDALLNDL
ncbi:MAG: hypothetical protein IKN71_07740 [Alphaproteobacteria bacterium]|nr:hypothetical protein [Alphaproteobacteria bacterium]